MTSVSHADSSTSSQDILSTRQTPWSLEAEQAVIAAMLLDADAVSAVIWLDSSVIACGHPE